MKQIDTLSVPQVARRLGCSHRYAYALVRSGKLKAKRTCGRWLVSVAEVEAFLRRGGR
ncbi:MAG: helix-turn-helix domain-containing protein [Acidobacteriia bacterium]|nr:helix-turn-helix domain-containing protein [Terriglobia bacterium]